MYFVKFIVVVLLCYLVDIFLFDFEEWGFVGLCYYVDGFEVMFVVMVNVDIGIFGQMIVYGFSGVLGNDVFYEVVGVVCSEQFECMLFCIYLLSDECSFQVVKIFNILFVVLLKIEVYQLWLCFNGGVDLGFEVGFLLKVVQCIYIVDDMSEYVDEELFVMLFSYFECYVRVFDVEID